MAAKYLVADVFDGLATLEDGSVDLVVTSPPFLALRSYLPADHPEKDKEIGSESTPAEFLDVMFRFTAELRRVLAPHGSICVELGDTYAGGGNRPDALKPADNGAHDLWKDDDVPKRIGDGWPLAKSKTLIPELYRIGLAYGINPLTGQESPAGKWRVRNVVTWARPNPPVGALGDKWRPATSDVVIACVSGKRFWDDLATRKPYTELTLKVHGKTLRGELGGLNGPKADNATDANRPFERQALTHSGAPLLDYWEIPLDGSEPTKYGPKEFISQRTTNGPKSKAADRSEVQVGYDVRMESNEAGAPLLDYWEIPPTGYSGSHYAVFPPALVEPLVKAMCPQRVCLVCGEPSRRLLTKQATWDRQPELATHIKERREALGLTSAEINGWFGYKEIAKNWERTDPFGAAVPNPSDWPILKERLGLSDDYDDFIVDRRYSETDYYDQHGAAANGSPRVLGDYQGSGSHSKKDGGITAQPKEFGWSDCGHNDFRPGLILDPFAGSGTTLLVATGHGHDAIGIDIDERNAELARDRVGPFLFELVDLNETV